MAGNYNLGSTVKIPLQVTEGFIPIANVENARVRKIIKPDGSEDPDFPKPMINIDSDYSLYYLDYTPSEVGDYLIILTFDVDGQEYSTLEHIIVSRSTGNEFGGSVPRAKALWGERCQTAEIRL